MRPLLWLVRGDDAKIESFYLSRVPVTNEQYEEFDASFCRSSRFPGDQDPATGITYERAVAYCRWYAGVSRKPMRLPTETEWEHACRAGSEADRPEAGELDLERPNGFGLHRMLGGVWEWCAAPDGESMAPLRGGSWATPVDELTFGLRKLAPVDGSIEDAGFRIAKSLR